MVAAGLTFLPRTPRGALLHHRSFTIDRPCLTVLRRWDFDDPPVYIAVFRHHDLIRVKSNHLGTPGLSLASNLPHHVIELLGDLLISFPLQSR